MNDVKVEQVGDPKRMQGDPMRLVRRTGITAREAVALSGLTEQFTLTQIYESKVKDIPLPAEPAGDFALLFAFYKKQTGHRLERHGLLRHSSQRFAMADPGWAAIASTTTLPKEGIWGTGSAELAEKLVRPVSAVKSTAWGKPGGQVVPPNLYAECQWEMAVAGKLEQDLAVRFVGGGFAVYTLRFVEEMFSGYYSIAEHFMSTFVFPEVPPPLGKRCCERDSNGDGNCDRHSAPGRLREPRQPKPTEPAK